MSDTAHVTTTGRFYRSVYVVGDVHGSLEGIQTILKHAGLINDQSKWSGRRSHFVQCGDIVDRGPKSSECLEFLLELRRQARRARGSVDLLVGNHELALARGDYSITDVKVPSAMGARLAKLIRSGTISAARSYRHYLMTHAGVSPKLMEYLVTQVKNKQSRVTVAAIARHLNQQLKRAFSEQDFSHPMFHVGRARGGTEESGGIFWADFDFEHNVKDPHPKMWQIFGHTPPSQRDRPFRSSPDERRVNIDVGISNLYGGYLAYVKLEPERVLGIHCDASSFKEDVLATVEEAAAV